MGRKGKAFSSKGGAVRVRTKEGMSSIRFYQLNVSVLSVLSVLSVSSVLSVEWGENGIIMGLCWDYAGLLVVPSGDFTVCDGKWP